MSEDLKEEKIQEGDNQSTEAAENVQETEALSNEEKLSKELNEANDKYIRLYSEFENFRRRTAKEKLDMVSTASESVILSILPILDDFDRAAQSKGVLASDDAKAFEEGFNLLHAKLKSVLENQGLKQIDAIGKTFDLDYHEAVTKIPVKKKKEKGTVVDVIEPGYMLGDKVIRFAKVVVGE